MEINLLEFFFNSGIHINILTSILYKKGEVNLHVSRSFLSASKVAVEATAPRDCSTTGPPFASKTCKAKSHR